MTNPRVYNEAKAKRSLSHKNILTGKLLRSLKNRTDKEKFWDSEIKAIESAWVTLKCKTCGKPLNITFSDWQNGRYTTQWCFECNEKRIKKETDDIYTKIHPLIPEDYVMQITRQGDISIELKHERRPSYGFGR